MALNQITYTDKVENSGATDDGLVLAVNMNEIKQVTNATIDSLEGAQVAIGSNAGGTSQGLDGTALGNLAGQTNQGDFAVSIGSSAGQTGQQTRSVAIGVQAGADTQSNDSVAIGREAGKTTMGARSVAIGQFAGQTSMGIDSVALGNLAGQNSMGANSVAIGSSAGITNQPTNSTCLGNNAQVTALNQVQLGNSATSTYAYGAVQDRSDARDKADIQDIHLGLDFIKALTPKSYKFDYREDYREHTEDEEGNIIFDTRKLGEITHDGTHTRSRLHTGLIAQEVKQVMDAQGVDFSGYQDHSVNGGDDVLSLGYTQLIAPMIKAIQELEARIAVLEAK
jgi:hypothetical protein